MPDDQGACRSSVAALAAVRWSSPATGTLTGGRSYQAGIGFADPGGSARYLHGDQIGTLRAVTDGAGAAAARPTWTAFGEPIQASGTGVPPVGTRYGYAGSWGYEEAECRVIDLNGPEPGGETTWCDPLAELGWLHVGHRYYDPSSGRFVQRDRVGIRGGFNVYEYIRGDPLRRVDPTGLDIGVGKLHELWPKVRWPGTICEEVFDKGSQLGKGDKWMHHVVTCRIASESPFGEIYILPLGVLKEISDNIGPNPSGWVDSFFDIIANLTGYVCAGEAWWGSCDCETSAGRYWP